MFMYFIEGAYIASSFLPLKIIEANRVFAVIWDKIIQKHKFLPQIYFTIVSISDKI